MEPTIESLLKYEYSLKNSHESHILDAEFSGTFIKKWIPQLPEQFLGIEIEVEKCPNLNSLFVNVPDWFYRTEQDGSLRNNGVEIITFPYSAKYTEFILTNIFKHLPKGYDFSPRTSIHIHTNIRDLTQTELSNVIYTYIAVEKILYNWIGSRRHKNIFCVPLQDTDIAFNLENTLLGKSNLKHIAWMKYTGLNLLPIITQGTIEFRHMNGTDNVYRILEWINIIQKIFLYAKTRTYDQAIDRILKLNSNSEYRTFLEEIFEEKTSSLFYPEFEKDLESGISYIKNYIFTNNFYLDLCKTASKTSTLHKRLFESEELKRPSKLTFISHEEHPPAPQLTFDDMLTTVSPNIYTSNTATIGAISHGNLNMQWNPEIPEFLASETQPEQEEPTEDEDEELDN